ncbi:MAG TPA: hybrid sensor histidine kinase/response regulator, partial [Leptolyngbyaceae cyanobacterium]
DTPGWDLDELWSDETSEEADALNLPSVEMEALNFEEDLFGDEASSQEWDLEPEAEATAEPEASIFDWEAETAPQAAEDLEPLLSEETSGDTDVLDVSEENLVETELPSAWELDSADEGAAEEALDWEGAIAQETTESLEDFLGGEIDDVTDTQDWDEFVTEHQGSSEEWSFDAEEDETAAALGLDWETTDSDRASETAPEELELPNLQSSVAEPVGSSPVSTAEWDGWDDLLTEEVEGTDQTEDFSFLTAHEGDQALDFDDVDSFEEALFSSSQTSEFDDLEAMLFEETSLGTSELDGLDSAAAALTNSQTSEFDDLEAMLAEGAAPGATFDSADIDFHDLEALLSDSMPANAEASRTPANRGAAAPNALEDDFGDLEKLLEQADKTMGPPTAAPVAGQTRPPIRSRPRVFEQTMRVPVKHLDSLSNLVGELVVNRNSLEQDQERLRQFLDNLSHQVLALSDVGSRMQDLYERSLLETSLLASRQSYRSSFSAPSSSLQNHNSSGVEYDPLEMDRFTGFHLLSQEMIELIVRVRESASDIEFLVDETDQVARMLRQVTTQLQEGLTRSRMVPFAQMADRLPRAVREISMKLRKEAQLHVDGRETLIDKMILEHLSDPMTHLINNALTHGIEAPDVRRAAGKPSAGQITLRAFHQGNQTVISVSDDGAGINPEQVRKKAIERRLITPAEAKNLTPLDLYNFLFHPGFTTKDSADDFAGRGVGMDVVLTSLSEIRGTIHIDSALGKGTTFTIRLPLTLSICKALCCLSDRARLAFPMDGVEDMLDVSVDRVQTNAEGQTSIRWRDTQLPFQPLSELLTYNRHLSRATVYGGKREDDMISIVVLRSGGNFIAIQVDQVLGEQEIVIKQLEGPAPKPVGIAGATVLGDGRIMPIADVLELIDLSMGRIRKDGGVALWAREENQLQALEEEGPAKTEPMVLIVDDSITVRELLSMTFNKAGYRVEQARDGQEAWDKLRSGLPCDIVFCDIEMPRMDGLELLSRLQKDDKLSHLPIAMLTSRGADRHRQMAAQLGASGYFTKPYLEEVLLEAAQRMIKGEVLFNSNSNA